MSWPLVLASQFLAGSRKEHSEESRSQLKVAGHAPAGTSLGTMTVADHAIVSTEAGNAMKEQAAIEEVKIEGSATSER